MTAMQSPVATIIHNIYTEKRENYLNSKNYDVTTFVKDWATGELQVKIQIPYNQLASFLTKLSTQNIQTSTSILSEDKKRLFSKIPGKNSGHYQKQAKTSKLCIRNHNFFKEIPPWRGQDDWPESCLGPLVLSCWVSGAKTEKHFLCDTTLHYEQPCSSILASVTLSILHISKTDEGKVPELRCIRPPQSQSGAIFCRLNHRCVVF